MRRAWKIQSVFLGVAFSWLLLGCGATLRAEGPRLYRIAVAASDGQMAPGIEILLVSKTGTERLGRTDGFGYFEVRRDRLEAPDALVLLACHDGLFCGAFRLDVEDALPNDEMFIALAPFAIP